MSLLYNLKAKNKQSRKANTILSSSSCEVIMDSSATLSGCAQIVTKQYDKAKKKSLSSSSSSSSSSLSSRLFSLGSLYFPDESPLSSATPLKFSGVPFSWETLPGIPKKNIHNKKDSLLKQLPPPPTSMRKKFSPENLKKDPFIAALVECSKDDDIDNENDMQDSSSRNSFFNGGAKITRSISDRFGFINLYTSCKKSCAVSESLVYLPRSTRTSYDLIHHHHHHHHHHPRRDR